MVWHPQASPAAFQVSCSFFLKLLTSFFINVHTFCFFSASLSFTSIRSAGFQTIANQPDTTTLIYIYIYSLNFPVDILASVFATSHRVCPLGERGKALAAADMPRPNLGGGAKRVNLVNFF